MRIALLGRNKLGLVDESLIKETFSAELYNQWERVNAIVLFCQINFVSSILVVGVVYASCATEVWDDLK